MGIRYYAYAFDADLTEQAVNDPRSMMSSDPLADAWGMQPHAAVSVATFEQVSPKRDLLYLDKAWSALQSLTKWCSVADGESSASPMFDGAVTMRGLGWDPWVRTIRPDEVPSLRDALTAIDDTTVREWARTWRSPFGATEDDEVRYVLDFLHSAQTFVTRLADYGRGMVCMIG